MYMFTVQSFSFIIFTVLAMFIIMIRLCSFIIYTVNVLSVPIYIMHFRPLFNVIVAAFI